MEQNTVKVAHSLAENRLLVWKALSQTSSCPNKPVCILTLTALIHVLGVHALMFCSTRLS